MNSIKKTLSKNLKFPNSTNINSILHNKYVLYVFVLMAVIDLMYFASSGDMRSFFTLIIVGFLTSFFSKNMIVIIFLALVFNHILKYGTNVSEGMDDMSKTESSDISLDNSGNIVKKDKKKEQPMSNKIESLEVDKKDKKPTNSTSIDSLQKDFQDFQNVQEKILSTMKTIDPLLTKAESFIEKFEHYTKKKEQESTNDD